MDEGFKPCPHCAEPIREAAKICRYCNRPVDGSSQPHIVPPAVAHVPTAAPPPPPKKGSSPARLIVGTIILLFLLFVVIPKVFIPTAPLGTPNTNRPLSFGAPPPQSVTLASGSYAVQPGAYWSVRFTVPQNAARASVKGSFHAFGGSGNDIQVLIALPSEIENLMNGHEGRVFYNSEKTTNGEIDIPNLAPGDYVLAFNNAYSRMSRKDVTADITMTVWPK